MVRMSESFECVVIGAGVVGLAIAREMTLAGRTTLCVEKESVIGSATSSRNSEVIHAGIHYRPGSLKARLCLRGKRLLYRYCEDHHVPHMRCGKLIVATGAGDLGQLEEIKANARDCGVDDLELLDQYRVRDAQPELRCEAALWSPSTGIVDSHALMVQFQADLEAAGGLVALRAPVVHIRRNRTGFAVELGGKQQTVVQTRHVINAAGLQAHSVAQNIEGLGADQIPEIHYAKGSYFALQAQNPFQALVYPVPDRAGLGIHLTRDLAGTARFGPDVEWVTRPDYRVDPARACLFAESVRRYWPGLPDGSLQPAYAGIRPKLAGPGQAPRDFVVQGEKEHGLPGLINLFGIESPGLTSCLALAAHVRSR
jgi:L-2-hydroxyglutarate oxidase LhgO